MFTVHRADLRNDCFDGSIVNGEIQSILITSALDKPPCFENVCEPETIYIKKTNTFKKNFHFLQKLKLMVKLLIFTRQLLLLLC